MKELRNFIFVSLLLILGFNMAPRFINADGTLQQGWRIGNIGADNKGMILKSDLNYIPSDFQNRQVIKLFDQDSLFASLIVGDLIINNGDGTKYGYVIPYKFSERSGLVTGNMFVFDKSDSTLKKITYAALRDSLIVLKADYPNLANWDVLVFNSADSSQKGLSFNELVDSLSIDSVRYSYNLLGGAANKIPVQFGADSTIFIDAPGTGSRYLKWNGSTFSWEAFPLPVTLGGTNSTGFTGDAVVVSNSAGTALISYPTLTLTELSYLVGVTSSIQTQFSGKADSFSGYTGAINFTTADGDYGITVSNGIITGFVFTP